MFTAARAATILAIAGACASFGGVLPVRGLHCAAPLPADVELCAQFIEEVLPKEGVNVLVLEFNYRYQYASHPEVVDEDALSRDQVQRLVEACRKAGVQLIPQINCLGHQSWRQRTFGLLRAYPEFDETPGKYPNNEGIYCRSYCPLHPKLHQVLFDLIDELADACQASAFHVGMDEVFLLGEQDCPRCRGRNPAELFAGEVRTLRDHLMSTGRQMWMWGDRFIDGDITGIGKWEASQNNTAAAIHMVPRDIVICDWHYDRAEPTAFYFATHGFPVVSSPWRKPSVALGQLDFILYARQHASPGIRDRLLGVLQTSWQPMASFVKAYYGKETPSLAAAEAALCFKELFREIRQRTQ